MSNGQYYCGNSNTYSKKNPYAGWKSGTLKYEKITYRYPANWTVVDKSTASPKSGEGCAYPGHDLITLTSPTGSTIDFNAGQACFGYQGDKNYGSVPVKSLEQNLYIGFLGYADPVVSSDKPDAACLIKDANDDNRFVLKSKNIFFDNDNNESTSNMFCYTAKVNINSADSIKNSPDFPTAKLIFESMKY